MVRVKRYGGGRLYDPAGLRYVSVAELREWAAAGVAFRVVDAQTGAEVTAEVLG